MRKSDAGQSRWSFGLIAANVSEWYRKRLSSTLPRGLRQIWSYPQTSVSLEYPYHFGVSMPNHTCGSLQCVPWKCSYICLSRLALIRTSVVSCRFRVLFPKGTFDILVSWQWFLFLWVQRAPSTCLCKARDWPPANFGELSRKLDFLDYLFQSVVSAHEWNERIAWAACYISVYLIPSVISGYEEEYCAPWKALGRTWTLTMLLVASSSQ